MNGESCLRSSRCRATLFPRSGLKRGESPDSPPLTPPARGGRTIAARGGVGRFPPRVRGGLGWGSFPL
jgi:hypothetical protein